MSSKNKDIKQGKTANLDPMVCLRESVKTALTALNGVLDAVNAVCDEAARLAKQAELTPGLHPASRKSAQKAFQDLADSRKKAAEAAKPGEPPKKSPKQPVAKKPVAKKQAEKPTTDDQAGKPGNAAVTGAAPAKQVKKTSASVRLTPHELTLNIGAQPVRELAEADAKDLLNNPKIFWYRPIQFPDPKRYQVQPRIESARVVERKAAKFTRAPWTVSVTIAAIGDDKRCESWLSGVLAKNKGEQE